MSGFNLPPGVSAQDIPGNTHADACEICGDYPLSKVCHAIALAETHAENRDAPQFGSALLALEDAQRLHQYGDDEHALNRAMTSLRYSVGIFHPDYRALVQP
jgi:hypothetical protein